MKSVPSADRGAPQPAWGGGSGWVSTLPTANYRLSIGSAPMTLITWWQFTSLCKPVNRSEDQPAVAGDSVKPGVERSGTPG
ncbi:MAG: hypothetical protein AABN95_22915 [Acidobacteriota bacterium]